jgi:hypothetical protein
VFIQSINRVRIAPAQVVKLKTAVQHQAVHCRRSDPPASERDNCSSHQQHFLSPRNALKSACHAESMCVFAPCRIDRRCCSVARKFSLNQTKQTLRPISEVLVRTRHTRHFSVHIDMRRHACALERRRTFFSWYRKGCCARSLVHKFSIKTSLPKVDFSV